VLAAQEVGTLTYLVHDAVTTAGTPILSFNAQQLRMIAASRNNRDRVAAMMTHCDVASVRSLMYADV